MAYRFRFLGPCSRGGSSGSGCRPTLPRKRPGGGQVDAHCFMSLLFAFACQILGGCLNWLEGRIKGYSIFNYSRPVAWPPISCVYSETSVPVLLLPSPPHSTMLTAAILVATSFLAACLRAAPSWSCVLVLFQPGTILDEEGGIRLMSLG